MMNIFRNRISPTGFLMVLLLMVLLPNSVWAAGQVFWDWPAGRSFDEMELQGAALDLKGSLVPGLQAVEVGPVGAEVCWRVVPDNAGGFFTGTGHGGEIFHTTKEGQTEVFATLEGAEVFSLMVLSSGELLAGCGPDGHLYRISAQGESTLLGQIDGGYVWGLTTSIDQKIIWLAVGSPAAIYRYTEKEGLVELVTFPAENTLDVMLDLDGSLLAATQGPGLVYRVDPENPSSAWLICETLQDEVRQFVRGQNEQVFFLALKSDEEGSAADGQNRQGAPIPPSLISLFGDPVEPKVDKAALFRLEAGNQYSNFWSGNLDLMIVAWSPHWGWLGGGPLASEGGQSVIHHLVEPASHHSLAGWSGGDILDLNVLNTNGGDGDILVGQAHPGGVQRLGVSGESSLQAVSPTLDAGRPVQWGRLSWSASSGPGKARWSVRGGNRSVPDESWTTWSKSWTDSDRELDLPSCRFLQWRVELPRRKVGSEDHWAINSVSVSAWQDNVRPVISAFRVENLSEISRGGLIGSSDNVTQEFASGLRVEFGRKSNEARRSGPSRAAYTRAVRVMTWQGKDLNADRLVYRLEYRKAGDQTWRPILDETFEQLGSWDTSEVPDGQYDLRLTASDHLDNPGELALFSQMESGPMQVDNTSPEISDFRIREVPGGVRVVFKVRDHASKLGQASVRMPDGQIQRLDPVDQICDSLEEEFDAVIAWPLNGREKGDIPWRLRVEVWDLSGNVAVAEGEAR